METTNKKQNIFLALLLSFLASIAGAIVFGVIYGIGYYIFFLVVAEIILACEAFFKLWSNGKWYQIIICIIWCLLWVILFNILAVLICESIFIVREFGYPFLDSFKLIIELWKTDPEIMQYMNKRVFEIVGMIVLGAILYGISFGASKAKAKNNNNATSTQTTNNEIEQTNIQNITNIQTEQTNTNTKVETENVVIETLYSTLYSECKKYIEEFLQSKDQGKFRANLKETKKLIDVLDNSNKDALKAYTENLLTNINISTLDKKINETILKLIVKKA